MVPSIRWIRAKLYIVLLVLPTLATLMYMIWPSGVAAVSVMHFQMTERQEVAQLSDRQEIVRRIQRFFVRYPVTITHDDIFVHHQNQMSFKVKGCLRHAIAVYVPFMIRYPVIGRTTYEWCMVVKK